jgi:hypothetical protein
MNVRELSIGAPRAAVDSKVTVSIASAQSADLAPGDYNFVCDQACSILVGANPIATTSCARIPANTLLRIAGVQAGEKIAVIADADGSAFIWKD